MTAEPSQSKLREVYIKYQLKLFRGRERTNIQEHLIDIVIDDIELSNIVNESIIEEDLIILFERIIKDGLFYDYPIDDNTQFEIIIDSEYSNSVNILEYLDVKPIIFEVANQIKKFKLITAQDSCHLRILITRRDKSNRFKAESWGRFVVCESKRPGNSQ